jgi:hypothetical protein
MNDERGDLFNSRVAALLNRDGRIVESRKRTFGPLKILGGHPNPTINRHRKSPH